MSEQHIKEASMELTRALADYRRAGHQRGSDHDLAAAIPYRVMTTWECYDSSPVTTPKQIRFLEQKGFNHVGTWGFEDASKMISRIQANGWKTPRGVDPQTYRPEVQL